MKEENQLSVEVAEADKTRRMLNSWTLELANWLMSEVDMTRKEAFRKAHLTRRLLDGLGRGVVEFQYVKENGEVREARGTLCPGVSEDFDRYEYKREDAEAFTRADEHGVYVYFDLERKAFRAFAAKRLVGMKGMKKGGKLMSAFGRRC